MKTIKTTMLISLLGLFLFSVTAMADPVDTDGLDVTITTIDADDQAGDVANDIQLPKEMDDADEHTQAGNGDHHAQESYEDHDEKEGLEENEVEDSNEASESAHEDSQEEMDNPDSTESSSTM
jgi:hypothetical protein